MVVMNWWIRPVLCGTVALLSTSACKPASIDDAVRAEASEAIRWDSFWEGSEALGGNYKPGSNVDIRVVRVQGRVYAILGPVHMVVDIVFQDADYRAQTVGIVRSPGTTNTEAAEWFFRMQGQIATGCIETGKAKPNSAVGSTVPIGRPCPPAPAGVLSDYTLPFTLPALTPPDAIQKKTTPPDRDALVAAVRQYVESRAQICGPLKARIPFYSDTDPRVYVLLPQAGDCPGGVATFSRATDSRWEFGKFIADVPKEELSGIIAKVESNTAVTVP